MTWNVTSSAKKVMLSSACVVSLFVCLQECAQLFNRYLQNSLAIRDSEETVIIGDNPDHVTYRVTFRSETTHTAWCLWNGSAVAEVCALLSDILVFSATHPPRKCARSSPTTLWDWYHIHRPTRTQTHRHNKLCGTPPQYAPPPASWPLTFWPWKWCPSHVWRGLPLCQF